MRMKQFTYDQHWYDELSSVFSIEEFPPLHSFSFNDWHWIGDEDLVHDHQRPLKTVMSFSSLNDFWAMIIDEQKDPKQSLYSDIVQLPSSYPSNPSPAIVTLHHYKRHVSNIQSMTHHEEQEEDPWPLRHNHPNRRYLKSKPLKPRHMQNFGVEDEQKQPNDHRLTRSFTKKKAPLRTRRVQHRTKGCKHR